MSLTERIVSNRHAVWALTIGVVVFGTVAYRTLPMQLFPDTAPPLVNVITPYPGASAEDVAQNLSRPLEEAFASLEGVVAVRSSSQDNLSVVSIEFRYDRESNQAAVDVQNAVGRLGNVLGTTGAGQPQVLKFDTSDRPVITIGVMAAHEGQLEEARRKAEDDFSPTIGRTPGVAGVDVFGGNIQAVLVEVDMHRLAAHKLPLQALTEAIRKDNVTQPAGRIRSERTETMFRVEARAGHLENLQNMPVSLPDGSRILLSQVADVRRGTLDDDAGFAINGRQAIAMQVFKADDANTVQVVRAVERVVNDLGERHPQFQLIVGEESASFTQLSVKNLLSNVWQAIFLAGIIIFLFLGKVRASLVAAVSMPLSFGMTFALMKVANVEFNMVTLSAIILAVGMVVDASIVVIENVVREREKDPSITPEEGAIRGTDNVRLPLLAGVASTLTVLVPLLFLPGFVGKTFGPLALTLFLAFSSSAVVALVLVPVLSLHIRPSRLTDKVGRLVTAPFRLLMDGLREVYLKLLRVALRHRLLTVVAALLSFAVGMAGIRSRGMEMLPQMDSGSFFVLFETPSGSSLVETKRVASEIEALLAAEQQVVTVQSQTGFETGMRSFSGGGMQGPTQGYITVTLTPRTARDESVWEIQERVRREISRIPGMGSVTVRELGNTARATTSAPVVVRITGEDTLVLDRLGEDIMEKLAPVSSLVTPVRNWKRDRHRTNVQVDVLRAGQLGLSPASVAVQMQIGSEGLDAGNYYGPRPTAIPIRVRYQAHHHPEDLLSYPILLPQGGESVPLRTVAQLHGERGQALVTRDNLENTLEISAFTRGKPLSFVIDDVEQALANVEIPMGYGLELAGEQTDMKEAASALGSALAVALIAVYLLLVAQLRSFLHPLLIMISIPLSLTGISAALTLTGKYISMPVMVGMILLVGIVVNNAIILLDFIQAARKEGANRRDAIEASVRIRFRPIMMTSISTMVGMIPLAAAWALGAERFSPLAIAVIGGMAASTILTIIVIPVLYDIAESTKSKMGRILAAGSRDPKQAKGEKREKGTCCDQN